MAEKESVKVAGGDGNLIQESQSGHDEKALKNAARDALLSKTIRASWEQAHAARVKWIEDKKEGLAIYWGTRGKKDFPFPNCLSKDTEILTERGWVGIAEVCVGDRVITRRDEDGRIEWAAVEATPKVYAEQLIHFKSNSMDVLATPDHEMIVRGQNGITKRMSAADLMGKTGYRIPLSGFGYKSPEKILGLNSEDVAEFVGWFLAEGSYNTSPSGRKGTISIAQSPSANPEKCARLEQLFDRLGFVWGQNRHAYTIHIRSMPRALVDIIHAQGKCDEKRVPRIFLTAGAGVARAMLNGLIFGDGSVKKYKNSEYRSLYTTSPGLADDAQVLALMCGQRATISTKEPGNVSQIRGGTVVSKRVGYIVSICLRQWAKIDAADKTFVDYNDYAHCVTVKNHAIYVRRNGIAAFVGNCANLHVPLTRTIADTLHSNLMGSIDSLKPASIMPVGPEDVPKARKSEKLLNWQFTTQVDYLGLADRIIQSILLFGSAPAKVRYVVEHRDGKKIFDGLKAEVIPVERFLVPPDAIDSDVEKMDYVMQEIPMTKSDLKKRKKTYARLTDEDLEKVGDIYSRAETEHDASLENLRSFYSGVDATEAPQPDKRYATVVEWYGFFDYDGDGIDEHVMASCLKERDFKVLRVVSWKRRRPFVLVNFSDIPGRAFGESVPDLLLRINQELNTIHNQRVDAVTITNIPFFFFDPSAGWAPDKVQLTPGLGIPVNGSPSQAVYFPALNTARPEMYREEDNLFLYAERMLGAGSNVQGIMQTKRTTATEIASVDRRAGIRFLTIFNRVRRGLREIFKLALELDREYMPQEIQVRITGIDKESPVFETIKRDDLDAQVDIVINGNSIIDDQAEKQEMMQAYQLGMMNPLIIRNELAVYELTKDLFTKLGVKRIDAYLKKPVDDIPKMPDEEHNLILQEEYPEPNLGENIEDHIKKHSEFINSESFKLLSRRSQLLMMRHFQDTVKMKDQLERMELISKLQQVNGTLLSSQTGGMMAPGMPIPGTMPPPAMPGVPPGGPSAP